MGRHAYIQYMPFSTARMTTIPLYPRHTGGAVPLRFLVKTAITLVTPPVVFHSFPLPVTHVSFFVVLRHHSGFTSDMAIPLGYNCGVMVVPRRSLAAWLRCWRQHCGVSEVVAPWKHRHNRSRNATASPYWRRSTCSRLHGGCTAEARR